MPFPIAIVGVVAAVVGGGIVVSGVVIEATESGHSDHSDYSDHSDHSDAAERREQSLKSKIKNEKRKLESARRELENSLEEAVRQMRSEYEDENLDAPDIFSQINTGNLDALLKKVPGEIKKSVNDELSARLADTQTEIARVNELLERINAFNLTEKNGQRK
jgi:DNA anti-recombination protein RmuC